jgi:hypothetical protein
MKLEKHLRTVAAAGLALLLSLGGASSATAAPLAVDAAGTVGKEHWEGTKDFECVTWIAQDGNNYKVAMRCDRIEKGVAVRGVLDISWASDKHTDFIGPDRVGQTVYSGSYGNLSKIRETRVEKKPGLQLG